MAADLSTQALVARALLAHVLLAPALLARLPNDGTRSFVKEERFVKEGHDRGDWRSATAK